MRYKFTYDSKALERQLIERFSSIYAAASVAGLANSTVQGWVRTDVRSREPGFPRIMSACKTWKIDPWSILVETKEEP